MHAEHLLDHFIQQVYQPNPMSPSVPTSPACPEDDTCCVDSGQPVSGWLWKEIHQSLQAASVGHSVSL